MESLALLVALIVTPAMLGGPLALALTIFSKSKISKLRQNSIYILGSLSAAVGIYLLISLVSRGTTIIGVLGIVTGVLAIRRTRKFTRNN
ncbi:MAG: phosphatase [Actinomycetota bacterium]